MKERNLVLSIILVVSFMLAAALLTRGHLWWDDFASYVMQGESILHGDTHAFIEHNTFTIFRSSFQIGPVAYPWGFPLILTPVYAVFGLSPLALKLPGLVFFIGFLICLIFFTRNRLTRTESLLLVSLFAFNPSVLSALDLILSDIPFLFFSTFALLLMNERKEASRLVDNALLGTIIFLAFFIRTPGIVLLASFLAVQLFYFLRVRDENKTIIKGALQVSLTFCLLWLASFLTFPEGQGSYFEQLKGLNRASITGNISGYFALFASFFGEGIAWKYVYYVLIIFFVFGAWTRRNKDQPLIIFFGLYLLAMILWPEWQGIRFIFPILPGFIYFIFQGISFVTNRLGQKQELGKHTSYVFWLVIIILFLYQSASMVYANLKNNREINGPFDPYSTEVFDFIKEKTPADSIIVFFKPRVMRLFTDRDSLMSTECDRALLGNYIVISKKAENSQIAPGAINACGIPLDDVFENRRFIVYKILK